MNTNKSRGFTLIEIMFVIAILALIIAIAVPNLIAARKNANETSAVEAMKTIATAETMFREGDTDRNAIHDYATLTQLGQYQVIDSLLGAGTRHGYAFRAAPSASSSEVLWFAVSNPIIPGGTGDRYFCQNQSGTVFYTQVASFALDTTNCAIPSNAVTVGK
jgi:type IV pilus assembly protein PilA